MTKNEKLLNLYKLIESTNSDDKGYDTDLCLKMVEKENDPYLKYLLLSTLYDNKTDWMIYLNEYKNKVQKGE